MKWDVEKWVVSLFKKVMFILFCGVDYVFHCVGVEDIEVLEGIDFLLPPCDA